MNEGLINSQDLDNFVLETTEALNSKVNLLELLSSDLDSDDTMGQYIQRAEMYSDLTEQDYIKLEGLLKWSKIIKRFAKSLRVLGSLNRTFRLFATQVRH